MLRKAKALMRPNSKKMSSSAKQTVIVFGATGSQGGSVLRNLLATGQYNVRAVTRNPSSPAAQELAKQGVQVVKGDASDPTSLAPVFEGASAAFLVTSFWDPTAQLNPETDWIQGKILVDAAVASKTVKFIVWSSLHDVDSDAQLSLKVGHFTNKNKVEQYIRQQTSIQAAFVYPGFYMQNWVMFPPFGAPTRKDGEVVLETAVRADVALPLIDIEQDFGKRSFSIADGAHSFVADARCLPGKFVAPLFAEPARFNGAKILAATEYLTVPQMAHTFEEVSGEHVHLKRLEESAVPIAELKATIQLFNRRGYYLGELLEPTLEIYKDTKFGTFKGWLQRDNFKPHSA